MNKLTVTAIVLLSLSIGYGAYSIIETEKQISDDPIPEILTITEELQEIEINTSPETPDIILSQEFVYGGWIPNWGMSKGLTSLENNKNLITEISPVWYYVNTDGTLQNKRDSQSLKLETLAKNNDIKIIPAIAMFDHEIFTPVLQNKEVMNIHIEAIIEEIEKHDYDGIDLDYESTKLDDKEEYFEFLELLSKELHARNKILYVTVLPKWTDLKIYASLPETRQVQDWSEISKYADKIRIMAYDYTYSKSAYPGPIAPTTWIEEILKYAGTKADMNKYILGLHLYAYEWYNNDPTKLEFQPDISLDDFVGDTTARAYTYDTVLGALEKYNGTHDSYQGEQIFSYEKNGEFRKLVYLNPDGLQKRVQLAQQYGVSGVAFWRFGGEEKLLSTLK